MQYKINFMIIFKLLTSVWAQTVPEPLLWNERMFSTPNTNIYILT